MPSPTSFSDATRAVEDAFYVSVGAGVLAAQRAQVRRRELEARLEEALDDVESALPEPLASILGRGRELFGPGTDATAA
ncbi:MAG: hypothetical protein AAGK32_15150 [Actinomycetota bacterium]